MTGAPAPRRDDDDLIVGLARAAAGTLDDDFLRRMVEVLRDYMQASIAFVGLGEGQPVSRVRGIYAIREGARADDIAYELDGAPCELVYRENDTLVVPCDLARLFPREAGLESYIGVPLRDGQGAVFGHLAVLSQAPIVDEARALGVVTVLAQRIEAELRRRALEEEREQLVADLRRQADRLRARERTIRAQNAHKTRLLGIIAHDLRNPLAAIISQAELAQAHLAKPAPRLERVSNACGKVIDKAARLSDLIDATLRRVREEDSNLTLSRRPCAVGAVLRLAVEAVREDAARKSIALTLDIENAPQVLADEELLTRAADNLVSNAVKYTPPGGHVAVSVLVQGDQLRIIVADDGQGLTGDDLDRLGGRFQTLSARPTGGESATGLGLANVRDIIEAHGGALSAESPGPGQGAVFTLTLPLG